MAVERSRVMAPLLQQLHLTKELGVGDGEASPVWLCTQTASARRF